MAPLARGDQVKELAESFHVVVERTGGLALLVVMPLVPCFLLWGGLQAAGRSFWSAGARRKRHAMAREILSRARYPGDEFYREIAETALLDYET